MIFLAAIQREMEMARDMEMEIERGDTEIEREVIDIEIYSKGMSIVE
jgi:hypothetical protein